MPFDFAELTEQEIVRRLEAAWQVEGALTYPEREFIQELAPGPLRPAAVLIPLLRHADAWHLLYTRRTNHLPEHSGQVAFPGGRMEPEDASPEATALREAQEEIGLPPHTVRILGRLGDYPTITAYCVTPVVAAIDWPFAMQLQPDEVSRVFTVPLDWLAQPENYQEKERAVPIPHAPIKVIFYNLYEGEMLWGASARMTQALLGVLGQTSY